jgi:hypothetical protein
MRSDRHVIRTIVAGLGLSLAAIGTWPRSADAQQAPPTAGPPPLLPGGPPTGALAAGLQVTVTPYLWLSGINAAIDTPLRRAPVVDTSVGAFQLLGDLDSVPVMLALELRDGPFSLSGDVLHVPVTTSITTRNVFFQGGSAELNVNTGTALLFYHVLEEPGQSIDAGIGFRAWDFYSDFTLNGRTYVSRTVYASPSAQWADPLLAGRYHHDFGHGFGLTCYGDVGGFGVGAHADWQVIGTIDYQLKPWAAVRLGYRSLNFDYTAEGGGLGFNVHMKGPILAATFRF